MYSASIPIAQPHLPFLSKSALDLHLHYRPKEHSYPQDLYKGRFQASVSLTRNLIRNEGVRDPPILGKQRTTNGVISVAVILAVIENSQVFTLWDCTWNPTSLKSEPRFNVQWVALVCSPGGMIGWGTRSPSMVAFASGPAQDAGDSFRLNKPWWSTNVRPLQHKYWTPPRFFGIHWYTKYPADA